MEARKLVEGGIESCQICLELFGKNASPDVFVPLGQKETKLVKKIMKKS